MTLHLHWRGIPVTVSIKKGKDLELDELRDTLIWYALSMPIAGVKARDALRRLAKAGR
ncbi:MAG: hypothetical protein ABSF77_18685 [Spirochaetia bacterium]